MKTIPEEWMHGAKFLDGPDPTVFRFGAASLKPKKKKLPKKVNIKAKFSPVYEQNCGCCTTCASLACDDYYYHGSAKPWVPSWKFTYYLQRKKQGDKDLSKDGGSIILYGLQCIKKYGACSSKVWSNDEPLDKKPSKEAYENGLKGHEVTKYYAISSFTQLREALAKKYPVAISMNWVKSSYDPETFILDSWTKEEAKQHHSGHAVVIVGYDDTKKLVEIRNSWGADWGNNGYIYMTYDMFKISAHYTDAYAVVK